MEQDSDPGSDPAGFFEAKDPIFSGFCCYWVILGGGFKYFLFSPLFGEDSHFD